MGIIRSATIGLAIFAVTLSGCGSDRKPDVGAIGQSLGKNLTEFTQGVGSGVDNQMQIAIELSPELAEAGITHTIAKQAYAIGSPKKEISIYLMSSQAIECTLIGKAYNAEDQEIGRAATDVQFTRDDAQYISFAFPSEMDSQTVKLYKLAIKPNAP